MYCKNISILLLGLFIWHSLVVTAKENAWLDNFFPANYSGDKPPLVYGPDNSIGPAVVYCELMPEFVTAINMKTMDFEVDMQLSIEWNDLRLNYVGHEESITSSTDVPDEVATKIWKPWLTFENAKGTNNLLITPEIINIGPLWTGANKVNKVGINIYYRKTFRFTCHLSFAAYPFDIQRCSMVVRWDSGVKPFNPVTINLKSVDSPDKITVPPGFRLTSFKIEDGQNTTIPTPKGTMVLLRKSMVLVFERVFAQHLMLIFLPSILIVILSWVSFWLDVANSAPRVALGLTTLLTLSTQFNAAQRDLPPVADIKALDIWMFACIFMVFASLIEFAIAVVYQKLQPSNVVKVKPALRHVYAHNVVLDINKITPVATQKLRRETENLPTCCLMTKRHEATSRIDYISRIVFPFSFLLFNLIFWSNSLGGRRK